MTIKNLVILDAGHDEYVAGRQAPDVSMREWEFNNDMQYKIAKRCKDHNIPTYMTNPYPVGKNEIGLETRCSLANNYYKNNNKPKSIFISIHSNAHLRTWSSARGTETYVSSNSSSESRNFAKSVNDEIVKTCRQIDSGAKDRGMKVNDFYVVKNTIMPSCLIEYAFYTNQEDLKILKYHRDELTEATIRAICEYFNVVYKPPTNSTDCESKPVVTLPPLGPIEHYRLMIGPFDNVITAKESIKILEGRGLEFIYPDIYNNKIVIVIGEYMVKTHAYNELDIVQSYGYKNSFLTKFTKG